MIQLIVQGEEIDLFKDEVFAISKTISKIGQFDLRFGDVSIGFNVPLTSKNNRIFRYISNLNHDNIGAFRRFEGEIKQNDTVLSAGYYQVLSTNIGKKEIKIRFFGGNSDWFDLIKERFINEPYQKQQGNPNSTTYDLSYLDNSYEEDTIIASKDNSDGYFYFPVDNGSNSNRTDNNFTKNDFQVGVYEHTIFKNIFESVGIKTQGSLFNDSLFYQTIITASKDLSLFDSQNNSKKFRNKDGNEISKNTYSPIIFDINDFDSQWDGGKFTSDSNIDNLNFKLRYQALRGTLYTGQYGNLEVKCEYTINGVPQTDIEIILTEEYSSTNVPNVYAATFEEESFNFTNVKIGDTFSFSIRNINQGTPPADGFWFSQSRIQYIDFFIESFLSYDIIGVTTAYSINNALPKIKQSDFVKDIMFRLGVVSTYDPKKRILTLDKFEDLDRNKSLAKDYTNKLDLSKDITIDYNKAVQNYFKRSFIRYEEDENDVQLRLFKTGTSNKTSLGDGILDIDNDNLSDEGDIFVSKYAATKDSFTFPLNDNTFKFYIPYIPFLNTSNEEQDIKPRILIAIPNTTVNGYSNSYSQISINGNPYSETGYAYFAKQSTIEIGLNSNELDVYNTTLSFDNYTERGQSYTGKTLLERSFNLFGKILNNPITIPIHFNLNELDLQNYEPLTPIYLDFSLDSGYYYLEEISQYKGDGSTTKCNLVKI